MSSTSELVAGAIEGVAAAVAAGTITVMGKNSLPVTVNVEGPTELSRIPGYNPSLRYTRGGVQLEPGDVVQPGDKLFTPPMLSAG